MQHRLTFDNKRQLAFVHYEGEVHVEESVELLRRIIALPGWTPRCSRIVNYDRGLLGDVDDQALRSAKGELSAMLNAAYQGRPNYLAHVCGDAIKSPIVDYWVSLGTGTYPANLARFDTQFEAETWIEQMRAAE